VATGAPKQMTTAGFGALGGRGDAEAAKARQEAEDRKLAEQLQRELNLGAGGGAAPAGAKKPEVNLFDFDSSAAGDLTSVQGVPTGVRCVVRDGCVRARHWKGGPAVGQLYAPE